jgi:hypothetical protein
MFLTDVTMILIITVLPIFLMWVWLRSEHLHYFGHYFRKQPATARANTASTGQLSAKRAGRDTAPTALYFPDR